jgi:magnesium transporter
MTVERAADCLETMGAPISARLLSKTHPDFQVAALRLLKPATCKTLLAELEPEIAKPLEQMLRYPPGTAGGLMDPFVFTVPDDVTVKETLKRARVASLEMPFYVYVVDRTQTLVGVVSLKKLIRARHADPISTVMRRDVVSLSAMAPQPEIVKNPHWREFHTLPVTDEDNLFLGVVRYETIARLREELADASNDEGMLDTALALGELYWIGLSGVMDGIAGRGTERAAKRVVNGQE